jgi:hypothetical protein
MVRCLVSWKASIFPPVVLVCVLATGGCSSGRSPHGAAPSAASAATAPPSKLPSVIWDCGAPPRRRQESRVRPRAITFACADNGDGLEHAVWTTWTSTGATGTGVIWIKTCQSDCATGGIAFYPASITLSDIVRVRSGELLFTELTANYQGSGPLYQGGPDKGNTITHVALPTAPWCSPTARSSCKAQQ